VVTLAAWSVFFAVWVGRRGLSGPVVLADAALIVAMIAVHRLVVPAALISAGTTWMLAPGQYRDLHFAARLPAAGRPARGRGGDRRLRDHGAAPGGRAVLVLQALVTAALMTLVAGAAGTPTPRSAVSCDWSRT